MENNVAIIQAGPKLRFVQRIKCSAYFRGKGAFFNLREGMDYKTLRALVVCTVWLMLITIQNESALL